MNVDTVIIVDWSGGNDTGATPCKDAIWVCAGQGGVTEEPIYMRNRLVAERWLFLRIKAEIAKGHRVLIGFDFAFGYPAGFAKAVTGQNDPLALWAWLADRIEDTPEQNNRFEIAGQLNRLFDGIGPFWGNARPKVDVPDLPRKGNDRTCREFAECRVVETQTKGAFAVWQLAGAGAVGSQSLMGLPVLERLRHKFDAAVWPFQTLDKPVAFVEVWPSLIRDQISEQAKLGEVHDAAQVRVLAQVLSKFSPDKLTKLLQVEATKEGWILGVGKEHMLTDAAPPLRNDCFALPQGVSWTPVDDALKFLRDNLHATVATETMAVRDAAGRVLATDPVAQVSNPPFANAAVDGYGFAFNSLSHGGVIRMPLCEGRAAAGGAFDGTVPDGQALRVLTGARLPDGVDTLVLEEDVTVSDGQVIFHAGLKKGANARKAGEDFAVGDSLLSAGHRLRSPDLALLTASGVAEVSVFKQLRVGVLSTGDELIDAGQPLETSQIYDSNRPMLLSLIQKWGFDAVDLGRAKDNQATVRRALDSAAGTVDAILTSGGASAGDEDHVSRLLQAEADLQTWRIAIKPGRPLALALWQGVPVVGLPGNPVAALVCALKFARPALSVLSGQGWVEPQGFQVPAGFAKRKKAGRREMLRARITDGAVETFKSEGSGRISGLSWAEGLVELPDEAMEVVQGDLVTYYPYASFGLA